MTKKDVRLLLLFLMLIVMAIYGNSLKSPFYFDDEFNIVNSYNTHLRTISFESIYNALWKGYAPNRPIVNFSFAVNYYLGGIDVFGYHIVNISIHIITGFIIFFLLKNTLSILPRYKKDVNRLSLAVTLLWVTHPVNVQAVTYIVQRMTSMATMFYLLSLLCYIRARKQDVKRYLLYILSGVFWLIALGCKEISAVLPFTIVMYESALFKTGKKRAIAILMISLVPILIVGTMYLGGIKGLMAIVHNVMDNSFYNREFSVTGRLLTQSRVIVYYILLTILPLSSRLTLDYNFPVSADLFNPVTTILSIVIILLFLAFGLVCFKKKPLLGFSILWFFSNLAIESSIFNLEIIYEHRLYLPVIGLILFFVLSTHEILYKLNRKKQFTLSRYFYFFVITVIISFSLFTIKRNILWANDYLLWKDNLKNSPNDDRVLLSLAMHYLERDMYSKAAITLKKSISLNPYSVKAYNNLGTSYKKLNLISLAEREYRHAIAIREDYLSPHINLGAIYYKSNRFELAKKEFMKSVEIAPDNPDALNNLGTIYLHNNEVDHAMEIYKKAMKIIPDSYFLYNNLGIAYLKQRQLDKAADFFKKAIEFQDGYREAYNNLGKAYELKGAFDKAIKEYRHAIAIKATYKTWNNLGETYEKKGEMERALSSYKEAVILNPRYEKAIKNIIRISKIK